MSEIEQELRRALERRTTSAGRSAAPAVAGIRARSRQRQRTRRIAAAGVAVLVPLGLVALSTLREDASQQVVLVPATTAPPRPTSTEPSAATTTAATTTTVRTTGGGATSTLVVDVEDPPEMYQPVPFASLDLAGLADGEFAVATGAADGGAVVVAGDQAVLLDDAGSRTDAQLDSAPFAVVVGPGDVLYGLVDHEVLPREVTMNAFPLTGSEIGRTVASVEVDAAAYVEFPVGPFGQGPDGIVDRVRDVGTTVLPYVDSTGEPLAAPGFDVAEITYDPSTGEVGSNSGVAWQVDIRKHPQAAGGYLGDSPAAPALGGGATIWTSIGPGTAPDQDFYGQPTLPVVIRLGADGSAQAWLLPDEWAVASSDVWGTLLTRTVVEGAAARMELAWFDPESAPVTSGPPPSETPATTTATDLGIPLGCDDVSPCPSVAARADGVLVAYDPTTSTVTVHEMPERSIALAGIEDPAARLVMVGPDDVAYLERSASDSDPVNELLAISTHPDNAGAILARSDPLDGSGDSSLVASGTGILQVGCCRGVVNRPDLDDPLAIAWVDHLGAVVVSDGPRLTVESDDNVTLTVVRSDGATQQRWPLDIDGALLRDIPVMQPLDDGGVLVAFPLDDAVTTRLVRLWPTGTATTHEFEGSPAVLERAGTVIVAQNGSAVRLDPFA